MREGREESHVPLGFLPRVGATVATLGVWDFCLGRIVSGSDLQRG